MFANLFKQIILLFYNSFLFVTNSGPWFEKKIKETFYFDGVDCIIIFYGFIAGFILFYVLIQSHFNFYNNGINFPKTGSIKILI